jgi:hypothetical protein
MSAERESKVSYADSTATMNQGSESHQVESDKTFCISSKSVLISILSFIIVSNFVNLAFPVIFVFDNGYTLNTINAALGAVGIYFVVKERVTELPMFGAIFTIDILINLCLSIAKIVYIDTNFCPENFTETDLENCYLQANTYVVVASVTCALAVVVLGVVLVNLYKFFQILRAKMPVVQV